MEKEIQSVNYLDRIADASAVRALSDGDIEIEQGKAAFTSQFIISGTSSSRVTKVIDGVEHFEVILYFSCNFDCTTGRTFGARYSSSAYRIDKEAVIESVDYVPGYTVGGETPHYDSSTLGTRILGLYTMKIVAYIPYVAPYKTTLFMVGYTMSTSSEVFYRDNLTRTPLGDLRSNSSVLTGYSGVTTTNISGSSLSPGSISESALFSADVSTNSSASRLVATNADGVYELRN